METVVTLDTFTRAYIECALWSSTDHDGNALDSAHDIDALPSETRDKMTADCARFQQENETLLETWYADCGESSDRAGHDFWLTRNHHGAGYWDRWNDATPEGKIGRQLTAAAHAYGECDLYVGDDGQLYAN